MVSCAFCSSRLPIRSKAKGLAPLSKMVSSLNRSLVYASRNDSVDGKKEAVNFLFSANNSCCFEMAVPIPIKRATSLD